MRSLPERKREQIEELVERTRALVPEVLGQDEAAWPEIEPFVRQCYDDIGIDDLRRIGVDGLGRVAISLLERIQQRTPGEVSIHIFNPSEEGLDWARERTVVEIVTDDMPFLVDSLTGQMSRRELNLHLVVHPQIAVRRDEEGRLVERLSLDTDDEDAIRESVMHYQIDQLATQAERVELETILRRVLADVKAAVSEWHPMRDACRRAVGRLRRKPPEGIADFWETLEFLEWVGDDHFTFLGTMEYDLVDEDGELYLRPDPATALGLLRGVPLPERAHARQPVPAGVEEFLRSDRLLEIGKTDRISTVHRNVHMDMISLKRFDDDGEVDGEIRFLGLFTSMAYSIAARNIPMVRRKVERVIEQTRFLPKSHNAKMLRHIVENYPRDELFQISESDLYLFAMRILELQLRPRLALLVRRDDEGRFVTCMVYVPRDRHNTTVRRQIRHLLEEAFVGEVTAYTTRISERPLAQMLFTVQTRQEDLPEVDVEELEQRLTEAIKIFPERLREVIGAAGGDAGGRELFRRYENAFPSAYQQFFDAEDAFADIAIVDEVLETGELGLRLYRRQGALASRFHLRTFERSEPKTLSSFLPMLENMGLVVMSEIPFEVRVAGAVHPVWIRDFEVKATEAVDLKAVQEAFGEALRRVYRGDVESDGFNRLVLTAGLDWRQIVVLRAYCRYLRQTGIAFSQRYMEQTLARNAEVGRHLLELFVELFDPEHQDGVDREQLLLGEIHQGLDQVTSLDEDRILRRFLNLIQHTLRTNFYQKDADGEPRPYLSFKLDAAKITGLPKPRPVYEIFVYSPRVEAVHLRGGKVARGGIRWSDRLEDFRTEILGLVKSQMVKNAVIVPVGAKGGFIVKQPPAEGGREAMLAEGVECYKTMIRGLLDLTDNLVEGEVVPPPDVVRRDDDDSYLVVAADKGTATFSDIANGVAAEYDFWLGDAFASGGSAGYDHKKMAITARGAWESVKRHFREMDHDIQEEPFTCVGVGDMSGDVFGNGMLLSEQTRLVAAFNHLHVFVDPDPPTAEAFAERRRLFDMPRSSWADYDRDVLSEGGDIFDRQAKRITVSPQIKSRLGLSTDTLTPNELIQAILRAEVDLLWFGGIGTYVKHTDESHGAAGDRSNDEIRVSASEVQAKVIGEGANLGLTQKGRIEYALEGGHVNTDFIDNSGGVDCSDHEVNIKIALREAILAGDLERAERDDLLVGMTDEVARLVLRDNYLQSLAITLEASEGSRLLEQQARLMRNLEREAGLDRRLEFLPDDTTIAERREANRGLTRPEIAVLFAYAKIFVYNELVDSDLPDDPSLRQDLVRYFPEPLRERFGKHLVGHRLRREIVATHVTNSLVNRVGTTFVTRLQEETGRRVSDIARAYTAARDVFELREVWEEIEALDNDVPSDHQTEMFRYTVHAISDTTRWFLRWGGHPFDLGSLLEQYEEGMVVVGAQIEDLLSSSMKSLVRRRLRRHRQLGVPDELAVRLSTMDILPSACDVARCAHATEEPVERVGKVYFTVGERFGLDRLRQAAERLGDESPYAKAALTATLDDLSTHQAAITQQVVAFEGKPKTAIDRWVATRPEAVQRLERMRADFEAAAQIDLAMLTIAEREMRRVIEM